MLSDSIFEVLEKLWSEIENYYHPPFNYHEDPEIREQLLDGITTLRYLQYQLDNPILPHTDEKKLLTKEKIRLLMEEEFARITLAELD